MKKMGLFQKMMTGITLSALIISTASVGSMMQTKQANAETANGDITYHAALGIQTAGGNTKQKKAIWMNRFGYYGKLNANGKKNISYYGTDNFNKLVNSQDDAVTYDGTFTDAEIKDNGTYTVSLDGADFAGETVVSQLHIATDIPVSSNIQISNLHVKVDDKEILTMEKGFLENDETFLEYGKVFLAINHWRPEVEEIGTKAGLTLEDKASGFSILTGERGESVSISFTVSGFDKKAEQKVQQKEQEKKALAALIGTKKQVSGFTYKITNATKNKEAVTLMKDNTRKKTRTVPATVKIDGKTYKVTAIGASAFSKNKKLQKVVIGKNVKTIGKKAFYNCKKLKTIDVRKNTSLKKVGKNLTKNQNCKVLVPKNKKIKKAYQKLFQKLAIQ